MDGKKKILYVMGIDWNWIYQRPQIIEQYLEKKYDVTVVFPKSILNLFRKHNAEYPTSYRVLWTLPFQEKCGLIGWFSSLLSKKIFQNMNQYDFVIIGYPLFYRYIPKEFKGKIIFDCMDNYEALFSSRKVIAKIARWERRLIDRSDAIVVSAQKLYQKVHAISNDKKIYLIRNGTQDHILAVPSEPKFAETYKIGYFGTIAEWFDFALLKRSLQECLDIEYHLIGPLLVSDEKEQERIFLEGVVPHHNLFEMTKDYSCFVMPFIVNNVVEWVDPVKLYEYISMGKCIVSVKYPEIKRFEDYVYMYTNEREYIELIRKLKKEGFPPKYNSQQQEKFLKENSWTRRFEMWDKLMADIFDSPHKDMEIKEKKR